MAGKTLSEDIEKSTKEGHEQLNEGNLENASEAFEKAVEFAEQLKDGYIERACHFNLGACYVARGNAEKGIKHLTKALPPQKDADGSANYADLQYNLGIAYDTLGQLENAVECYEAAVLDYRSQENREMEEEVLIKLGVDLSALGQTERAAKFYKEAAIVCQRNGDKKSELLILANRATLLAELNDIDTCAQVLRQVIELCEEVDDNLLKGKIYNDIGLLYSGLKSPQNASECFELAVPLLRGPSRDKQLEATVHQNLGAVYNQLGQFEDAVECHTQAIDLHGELTNRAAQGQVFCNKGFAHSQLGDFEKASESFVHAVQAGKDSGDRQCHWQACEGLAAVSFLQENHNKAVHFYKEALSVLSMSGVQEQQHHERIINKLADALECQFLATKKGKNGVKNNGAGKGLKDGGSVRVNGKGSHRIGKTRPRQEHHRLIARGIDGGDGVTSQDSSDSDSSTLSSSSSDSEEVQRSSQWKNWHQRGSIKVDVHQERSLQTKKHPMENQNGQLDRTAIRETRGYPDGNLYEEPVDGEIAGPSSREKVAHYSPNMPRAHREAYLASVEASREHSKQEYADNNVTESKACTIQ